MCMISQAYLNALDLQDQEIVRCYQVLDTFGDHYTVIEKAVILHIRLEGTTNAISVPFLISDMTNNFTATVGQDLLRQYSWDLDFAVWNPTAC